MAVPPLITRRAFQRQFGEAFRHLLQCLVRAADLFLAVEGIDFRLHHEAIGEAGRVCEEIQHFHRPVGLARLVVFAAAAVENLDIGKFLDVAGDVMVQAQLAFLEQHHRGQRRDRLRHRIDAENRLRPDGLAAAEFGRPAIVFQRDLAIARNQRRHARQLAGVEIVLLEEGRNRREAFRIEANFMRVGWVVFEHLRAFPVSRLFSLWPQRGEAQTAGLPAEEKITPRAYRSWRRGPVHGR